MLDWLSIDSDLSRLMGLDGTLPEIIIMALTKSENENYELILII